MVKRFGMLALSVVLGLFAVVSLAACSSETYAPSGNSPVVSSPTIGKEGVLRVGVDASSSPFAGQTDSGIVGLNVDIAAAIADEMGLKLEIVDVGSDPGSALAAGTVDIVLGVDKTDTSVDFWTSDPYIQSAVALFSLSSDAAIPAGGSTSRVAAQISSMSAWEVNKQFGEESLISSNDLETAFSDLSAGSVDYVAADAIIGTYASHKNSVGAHIIGLLQKPSGISAGVADENSELKQVISDVLVKLTSNGLIDLIEVKWLGVSINLDSVALSAGATATAASEGATSEPEEENTAGENAEATTDAEGAGTETTDPSLEVTPEETL